MLQREPGIEKKADSKENAESFTSDRKIWWQISGGKIMIKINNKNVIEFTLFLLLIIEILFINDCLMSAHSIRKEKKKKRIWFKRRFFGR